MLNSFERKNLLATNETQRGYAEAKRAVAKMFAESDASQGYDATVSILVNQCFTKDSPKWGQRSPN